MQSPLVILASACGGLLGCVFNLLKSRMRLWRQRHPAFHWRLLESAAVALLTVAAVTGLPAVAGTCLDVSAACPAAMQLLPTNAARPPCTRISSVLQVRHRERGAARGFWQTDLICRRVLMSELTGWSLVPGCLQVPDQWDPADVMRYRCPVGQSNDLATALLGNGVWVIRSFLSMGSDTEPVNNRVCRRCCHMLPAVRTQAAG